MPAMKTVIRWFSREEGGRRAIPPGPRYTCPAKFISHADSWPNEVWDLVVDKIEEMGDAAHWLAEVQFRVEAAPHEWLVPGAEFELCEGHRRVAVGRIE